MELDYADSFHLHCTLLLNSGRKIILERFDQSMTYVGLFLGTPNRELNDYLIQEAVSKAKKDYAYGTQPYLIFPKRRDYLREPGDMQELRNNSLSHVPEWLPMVTCIADFFDVRPVQDKNKALSSLTVVWFQDEFALPISPSILKHIQCLDWERLATDHCF